VYVPTAFTTSSGLAPSGGFGLSQSHGASCGSRSVRGGPLFWSRKHQQNSQRNLGVDETDGQLHELPVDRHARHDLGKFAVRPLAAEIALRIGPKHRERAEWIGSDGFAEHHDRDVARR